MAARIIAVAMTIAGLLVALLAYYAYQRRCGDGCSEPPPWWRDPDAWQWTAQVAVAAGGLFAAVLATYLAVNRRRAAWSAIAGSLTLYLGWWYLISTGSPPFW